MIIIKSRRGITMTDVVVVIGAGAIGQAIARRVSSGKHIILADLYEHNAQQAADTLTKAGYKTSTCTVDVSSRESVHELLNYAVTLGDIVTVIHAAGVSPSQACPEIILQVDLYGTALVLELFGDVIAENGCAIVISSQSGHRLPALTAQQDTELALTETEALLALPWLAIDELTDSLHAYQLAKRANALRVKAESVRWAKRGARVNAISPGIIMTPLANDELSGPRGAGYRKMIDLSPAKRVGTADEVAHLAALIVSQDGRFITGSDFLIDGGVTASYFYGDLSPTLAQ